MAGDVLIGRDGRKIRLLKIEQQYVEEAPICNLTIDHNHSFAVGTDGLLVHNTAGCGDQIPKGSKFTEPTLPDKRIVDQGGVKIEHYTRGNDHLPAHAHLYGGGDKHD